MVSDDVILEQVEYTYDGAGNVIQIVTRQRYHNAPDNQTGPLNDPGTTPKARVTYLALYPDALGRTVATADYGTNGGAAFTRSATIPARSDTVLVTTVEYDSAGNVLQTTDPKGIVTRYEYDDLGRKVTVIEDDGGTDRTTRATYTPDGLQATLVAENADTGNQTTTYTYGTTLSDSDLATSTLLRTVAYPDSTGGGDTVTFSYNRQGERTTATDQRGCVHTYDRDLLGRLTQDRVTTLGTGVDGAVRRLSATFDVRGLPSLLTSHDHATVGSGSVVNQVQFAYNGFAQLTRDYQSHSGAVNTGSSPNVQLAYANGSANTIRPTSLVYPDGRTLTYDYGTTDGIDDACSRVASLVDDDGGSTHLADYSFLGLGATVVVDFTEPDVKYTLVDLSGTNDPDTGDIYSGLGRFGRVKDCRWYDYGGSADTARLKYGYDRASNRLWREDTVAVSLSKNFDELYAYDGLHRLEDLQRGRLNGGHTSISSKTFAQAWTLDATGNWQGFEEAATGGSLTLDQSRDSNTVNEITGITNSVGSAWATPAHDPAGNMTTIPQPADPTLSYTATFDAWNRLVKLVDDDTSDTVQENQYDARTFRTVRKDYTGGTLSEERHCYYTPGWRCVEERLGSSPDSADPDRQFVWGNRYIDDLVCRDRDTDANGSLDERLYATQDANWNVVALIDTTGNVQERYAYSAYGMTNVLTAGFVTRATSSYQWETTYCGYRSDAGARLLAVRNRFYHPLLGMWLTRDPIGYADGMNLYGAYFVPNGMDPYGLVGPNPYDPWYRNDWTDWINPFAYSASTGERLGGFLYTAYKDSGKSQGIYTAIQGNTLLSLAENQIDSNQARQVRLGGVRGAAREAVQDTLIYGEAAITAAEIAMIASPVVGGKSLARRAAVPNKLSDRRLYWHGSRQAVATRCEGGMGALPPGSRGTTYWATSSPTPTPLSTGALPPPFRTPSGEFSGRPPFINVRMNPPAEATYVLSPAESASFRPAYGPGFSLNPFEWWKGAAGQYYYHPTQLPLMERARQASMGAAGGTITYGLYRACAESDNQ